MGGATSTRPGDGGALAAWRIAIRPHTLPAAAAPVVVGIGLAIHDTVFAVGPAAAALVGALLIQIGTNLANDYFDAVKGVDTPDRTGFRRVTHSGLLPAGHVLAGTAGAFGLASIVGLYLIFVGGIPILVVGVASIASGLAYAGGPYPLGSYGLGDLFVFVFFGLVAVTGTYYVQAVAVLAGPFPLTVPPGTVTTTVVLASLPMACLTTAILVVNNIRDIETDRRAGKRTLAVIVGLRWSRVEYAGCVAVSYLVPIWLWIDGLGLGVLLPLLTLAHGIGLVRTVTTTAPGPALNDALERTGKLLAAYAALFAIGVVL